MTLDRLKNAWLYCHYPCTVNVFQAYLLIFNNYLSLSLEKKTCLLKLLPFSRLSPVWPNNGLKSSPFFQKLPKKVTRVVLLEIDVFKMLQMSTNIWATFKDNLTVKTLKNRPIWSHWLSVWQKISNIRYLASYDSLSNMSSWAKTE